MGEDVVLFDRSTDLYDAIYDSIGKDYEHESNAVLAHVRTGRRSGPATLVDVACGTGRHLEFFARVAECVGVDIDGGLLGIARRWCPNVGFIEADMLDFDLGESFDVVTCLFSSIGYALTEERLGRAVERMAAHLNDGGVLDIEPWFEPERWTDGLVQVVRVEQPDLTAVRMMRSSSEANLSVLDAHKLVARPAGIEHFIEHHEFGLFAIAEIAAGVNFHTWDSNYPGSSHDSHTGQETVDCCSTSPNPGR